VITPPEPPPQVEPVERGCIAHEEAVTVGIAEVVEHAPHRPRKRDLVDAQARHREVAGEHAASDAEASA
jgi:hypothetical protein